MKTWKLVDETSGRTHRRRIAVVLKGDSSQAWLKWHFFFFFFFKTNS